MALIDCPDCHAEISSSALACPICGCPGLTISQLASHPSAPSGASVAAMIFGISGLVLLIVPFFWFAAIVPAILAVVLSAIGFDRVKRNVSGGWGMAATGLVTGLISGMLYFVMWVLWQDAVRKALTQ